MSSKTIIDIYEFEPYPLGRPPEAPFKSNTCSSVTPVITKNLSSEFKIFTFM